MPEKVCPTDPNATPRPQGDQPRGRRAFRRRVAALDPAAWLAPGWRTGAPTRTDAAVGWWVRDPVDPAALPALAHPLPASGRLVARLSAPIEDWSVISGLVLLGYDHRPGRAFVALERPSVDAVRPPPLDVQAVPCGLAVVTDDRVFVNAAACEILGRSPVASTAPAAFWDALGGPLGEGRHARVVAHPDGSRRWVEVRVASRPPVTVCAIEDVTELDEQRQRAHALFDQARNPVLVFDATGILDGNQAALDILGLPDRDALLRTHPAEFSPERQPDGRTSAEKSREMDAIARAKGVHRFDWVHRRVDGELFPVEVTLSAVSLPTGPAYLVHWLDIRERLATAQALAEARDRAQAATQAKSAFLASMSHELRTPLNGIIGYSELLLESEAVACWAVPDVERVISAGRHLLALISDILDLSKIEAGHMEFEHAWFDVGCVVREAAAAVFPVAAAKGVAVVESVAEDVDVMLGDAMRVRQVLLNLLSNAAKFTAVGEIGVRVARRGTVYRFEVFDTGVGMGPEEQGRIFREYVQAEAGVARKFGGTGLGLAISRRLCEQMGGLIGVHSAAGVGSVFHVELPRGA